VLTALRESEGPTRTQAALAQSIGADKTRLIPILDDLQKRGLIARDPDPADRRVRLLALTGEGREKQRAIQSEIRTAENDLLNETADRAAFVRALRDLT
jgi:DNA-binding MarR family transcriptional regulator